MEMDVDTLIAGLLHDTVEDTDAVTFSSIEERFGPAVRRIVEGETKVSKLGKAQRKEKALKREDVKADDMRQMFLAMTAEVRVIIVKLADRLHNMRTLQHMKPEKQKIIALETLEVFAPLGKLLGMYKIKEELESISLSYLEPEQYGAISRRIDRLLNSQGAVVAAAHEQLEEVFRKDPFLVMRTRKVSVETITKPIYSIYRAAKKENIPISSVRDVAVLRIVIDMDDTMFQESNAGFYGTPNQVCYHVLGMIHAMWTPLPERVKDFIAMPKANGYRGLHTTVINREVQPILPLQLQIRTKEMHRVAELGIIAEEGVIDIWRGENGESANMLRNGSLDESKMAKKMAWLNAIQEWQDEFVGAMTAREFVDTITGDLLGSKVFVFTPEGEVMNLPKGATIVDHAYQIHTDVGNQMLAAKVNGMIRPPDYQLRNGDMVEIIKYDGPPPPTLIKLHRDFLKAAKTRSAIHRITNFLRQVDGLEPLDAEEGVAADGLALDLVANTTTTLVADGELGMDTELVNEACVEMAPRNGKSETNGKKQKKKSKENQVSLVIECTDRIGLLSDVSCVISKYKLQITAYTGHMEKTKGTFYMNYVISGDSTNVTEMCSELQTVAGVESFNMGWHSPKNS